MPIVGSAHADRTGSAAQFWFGVAPPTSPSRAMSSFATPASSGSRGSCRSGSARATAAAARPTGSR